MCAAGLGYGMVLVSGVVCIYYNVILAWSIYYLLHSFTTGELPWASCGNWWNTPRCLRRGAHELLTNATNATAQDNATAMATTLEELQHNNLTATTPAEEFWT